MRAFVVAVAVLWAGCGDKNKVNHLPDAPGIAIRVDPPDLSFTIVNGAAIAQAYTATFVEPDGTERDVTGQAVFRLSSPMYGNFTGSSLSITGQGSGPVRVIATAEGVDGDTGLTVYVKSTIIDADIDPAIPPTFPGAGNDPSLAPQLVYPLDNILVPPNLGQFDVHWRQSTANVFEVQMSNQYVDIKRYTNGDDANQPYWMVFEPLQWYPIASSRLQLTLAVTGMNSADTTKKGTTTQHVDVTNEDTRGGIYYWSTYPTQGIWRYDVATPTVAPQPFWAPGSEPSGCMGCHALSRDGTKLALTLDGAGGRGSIWNVADRTPLIDVNTSPVYWNLAAFTPDSTKLLTITNGAASLRDVNGGAEIATVANTPAMYATHPDFSPDGTRLVVSESSTQGGDISMYAGSLVTHTFDNATNTFGPPVVLVPGDANTQVANYYPSFSPDGQWIAYTRTTAYSYDDASAEAWVVKADGTQAPIKLATANLTLANLTNSWPRWVPFAQTFGATNRTMFYLTFSSRREFGVRLGQGTPQIWMTPFFPDKAALGQDPSGPAFRVPFQSLLSSNHIAQWTQTVVLE
jgi:WD40-like Beta Propeller Repeat